MAVSRVVAALLAAMLAACAEDKPDRLVASAQNFLAQGDHHAAMIQVRNALQQRPNDGAMRLLLGRILLDAHDPVAANRELRKALQYGQTPDAVLPLLARAMLEQGDARGLLTEFGPSSGTPNLATAHSEAAFKSMLGQAQLQSRRTAEAAASFRGAAIAVPGHLPAQMGLARVMALEGDPDAAASIAERLVAAHPQSAEAHMLIADLQALRGDPAASIAALEQAVRVDSGYLAARYALIAALISEQRFDAAAAQLKQVRALAKADLRIDYFQAAVALGRYDLERAREIAQRIVRYAPHHVPSLLVAAAVEMQDRRPLAAEIHLRSALVVAPEHIGARRMLVRTYLDANLPVQAREALQPLLTAAVADPTVAMLAGEAYLANGDTRQASAYFTTAAASDKTKAVARTRLAQIALATGNVAAGTKQLEQVAAAADGPAQADLALITGYMQSNELNLALQAAQRFAKKQPDRPLPFQLLGSVYAARKDWAAAREQFLKALEMSPSYLPAVASLSALDLAGNKPLEARQRFDAVVLKEPNNEQAWLGLADVLMKSAAPAADITATLQRAIRANAQSSDARVALITHYLRIGQASLALTAAQEAAAALPNDLRVLYALGEAQKAAGQTNQSIETFNRLGALQPQSKLLIANMAERTLLAGDIQSAVALYRSIIEQQPDNYVALNNLAWAAGRIGDPKAIEYAQRAVKIAPDDAAALDTLGALLVARGDVEQGVALLRKAKELAPKRQDIRLNYAKALIKAGRKSDARSELEALRSTANDPAGKAEIAALLKEL